MESQSKQHQIPNVCAAANLSPLPNTVDNTDAQFTQTENTGNTNSCWEIVAHLKYGAKHSPTATTPHVSLYTYGGTQITLSRQIKIKLMLKL